MTWSRRDDRVLAPDTPAGEPFPCQRRLAAAHMERDKLNNAADRAVQE
jgi:hypothetical protein